MERGFRVGAAAPLAPASTIEAAFIEYEMGVARGVLDHRTAVRSLAQLSLSELFALAVVEPAAFRLFEEYLSKAVKERLGPDAAPFELRGRNVIAELEDYLRRHATRVLAGRRSASTLTEQELAAAAEQLACELVVIAAKVLFRFYGLMRWTR